MTREATFFIITLGCAKNEFDSYLAARRLKKAGFREANNPDEAEFVILNTCSFIEDAVKETFDVASNIVNSLEKGQKFIFAGCAVNYFGNRIVEAIHADLYLSTGALQKIDSFITKKGLYIDEGFVVPGSYHDYETSQEGRISAYLKIAEGCSNKCSYCLIPLIRGEIKSVPEKFVLKEAERLFLSGVKEINLIAQDLASYGRDFGDEKAFYRLVRRMSMEFESEELWIRLLYLNPDTVDFEMLSETFSLSNIVPYLDMPVQSGSFSVLTRMNREKPPEEILSGIEYLRKKVKGLALRTTFLVGFPGETDNDFEETLNFVNHLRPDYCSVFAYSDMEGSPSFSMTDKINRLQIQERYNTLSEVCYRIMEEMASQREGTTVRVLIESSTDRGSTGRAFFQAPEIDGSVLVTPKLNKGQFVDVMLEVSTGVDFRGKVVGI